MAAAVVFVTRDAKASALSRNDPPLLTRNDPEILN
jgi:hypothetical protein